MTELVNQRFLYVPVSAVLFSLAVHLGFLVTMLCLRFTGVLERSRPFEKKSMYQNFIQVDIVALPDELRSHKSQMDLTAPIQETPSVAKENKSPAEDVLELPNEKTETDAKQTKLDAAKKRELEQHSALKKLEQEARREQALKSLVLKESASSARTALKGNVLSKGNARAGEIGTAKDQYNALVRQAIEDHFNIYPWQKKKNLLAIVHLEIFPTGRVRKKSIVKSSQDRLFDAAVLQAVEQAQPLPIPSDLSLIANGITVEFRPTD
jgi:TonB family protein